MPRIAALALLTTLLASTQADALLFRAYLASDGNDANPCTLASPCRLLPAALAAVANGGEIWMLDSANYNTATVDIDKSVSILAVPGAVGSVVTSNVADPAFRIATASLKVALRNLVIVPPPGGGGGHGVHMFGASSLTIENSLIANLSGSGVVVEGTGAVKVADTIMRNNVGSGVFLQDGATGTISRTHMLGNNTGVIAYCSTATTTIASVSDSLISEGIGGVTATTNIAGADARVFVTRSTIERTGTGLRSDTTGVGSTLITISYSMVTNNTDGWYQSGAGSVIKTLGNNHIADNTTTVGSLTTLALQ